MKKFFGEFKKFITRGNVVDMAVGVIVGSSFTAIVNALSNNILRPIINALLVLIVGKDSLSEVYTFLMPPVYLEDGTLDLAQCIYIDWGAFINAIINFFLIAIVLFIIVRIINKLREHNKNLVSEMLGGKISKEDKIAMKREGFDHKNEESVKAYFELKAKREAEAKLAAEEAAAAEKLANPSTEDLLKEIRDLLKNSK